MIPVHRLPQPLRKFLRRLPGADRARSWLFDRPRAAPIEPGQKRAVVYLPTWLEWDVMRQRPQYLLTAFARAGHPVFFVDPRAGETRYIDGVTIVRSLRQVPHSGVIIYLHFAPLRHLIGAFDDAVVVYDILDDLSIYDADEVGVPVQRTVRAHHPHLMERADIVMASNAVLLERHSGERADLVLVENGVDPQMFGRVLTRPEDVPGGEPLVGYHGMISHWFDFEMLAAVAGRRPSWQFVLVGPVDLRAKEAMERLEQMPNVVHVGERPSSVIPAYVQAFDVGVVWFQVNEMTKGVTPLKMYEYLAAGVPCVVTPLPAAVAESAVRTAGDAGTMVAAIEEALADPRPEQSRETARGHSWERRLAPVIERLGAEGLDRAR